jgi:hypothetical protein
MRRVLGAGPAAGLPARGGLVLVCGVRQDGAFGRVPLTVGADMQHGGSAAGQKPQAGN